MAMKIDSHQHFWQFDPVRDSWITEEMSAIRRDFLPKDLKPILDNSSIDGCIAVQAAETEEENQFLLSLAEKNNWIKGIVGWLNFTSDNLDERLQHYSQFATIKGFRYILQDHSKRDLMLTENFLKNVSLLEHYNYTYDILIFPDQLNYASQLVAQFPQQKFILDHIAKPNLKENNFSDWEKGIKTLAQYENVFCKISGMVTEADWKNWSKANYNYVLDIVTESFGVDRIVFGSDWPVCQLATSYENVKGILDQYFDGFSDDEKNKIYGENAINFYSIMD